MPDVVRVSHLQKIGRILNDIGALWLRRWDVHNGKIMPVWEEAGVKLINYFLLSIKILCNSRVDCFSKQRTI